MPLKPALAPLKPAPTQTLRRRFTLAALGATALPSALLPARALADSNPATLPSAALPVPAPAAPAASAPATPGSFAHNPAALAFARQLDAEQGWSDGWAERWIGHEARHRPQIVRLMTPMPRGTLRDWPAYRARFVEPVRIQAGLRFWQQHEASLERAEREFGVPDWLIVGIIGVETLYGRHMGTHRVLDALATLGFDFPPEHPRAAQRSAFFRSELAAFLQLSHKHPRPPDAWRGSFAGAIGLPQFMPSNWPRFGVDFDADGRIDLIDSAPDAIGSVARFLREHGWLPGIPTHFPLRFDPARLDLPTLLAPSIRPSFTLEQLQALGVQPGGAAAQHNGLLALVELEQGDPARGGQPASHWLGTQNFFAISRYNPSSYYVMAVIDLGQAVRARRRS